MKKANSKKLKLCKICQGSISKIADFRIVEAAEATTGDRKRIGLRFLTASKLARSGPTSSIVVGVGE